MYDSGSGLLEKQEKIFVIVAQLHQIFQYQYLFIYMSNYRILYIQFRLNFQGNSYTDVQSDVIVTTISKTSRSEHYLFKAQAFKLCFCPNFWRHCFPLITNCLTKREGTNLVRAKTAVVADDNVAAHHHIQNKQFCDSFTLYYTICGYLNPQNKPPITKLSSFFSLLIIAGLHICQDLPKRLECWTSDNAKPDKASTYFWFMDSFTGHLPSLNLDAKRP